MAKTTEELQFSEISHGEQMKPMHIQHVSDPRITKLGMLILQQKGAASRIRRFNTHHTTVQILTERGAYSVLPGR